MKTCRKCCLTKPDTEFRKNANTSGGRENTCKTCRYADWLEWVERNRESQREANRASYGRRAPAVYRRERVRRATQPEIFAAREQVRAAVKRGDLTRPAACERCRTEAPVEAHHSDYGRPLDVEWLCVPCHRAHHASEKRRILR